MDEMVPILKRKNIQRRLLQWFKKMGRDLPWRKTRDPYAIWISEIMLQQTQVATVIPYYETFLKSFPTVRHLARADLSGVLKVWEGLGYYSRARHLSQASKIIVDRFHGRIPDTSRELRTLAGVGRYTAGAILSIAYNKDEPILDGNVKRVLSRIFAISADPGEKKTGNLLWDISGSLIPKGRAGSFNQALMDLGALVCTPKDPRCPVCPLQDLCRGRSLGTPENYPRKALKKSIPHVEAVSAVIKRNGRVLLNRRPPKGLLGGLWEFPNWKIENGKNPKRSLKNLLRKEMAVIGKVGNPLGTFQHTYSHFKLTLHVYHCQIVEGKPKGRWVPLRNLDLFPMSRLHRRIGHTLPLPTD